MIGGIGTDLVLVPRIAEVLARHGERFASRVLTRTEMEHWRQRNHQARFLAKRFAAKEAVAKAMGTGIGATVSFQDLEIVHDALGRPLLETSPRLTEWMRKQGWRRCLITLSDEGDHALAFAVVEG